MELVEHHRGDAVEHRVVEDEPGKNPFGDDFDAGFARDFRAEAHPQADRIADAFAQRMRHPLRGGARGEPARLQHQDAAVLRPILGGEHQRHPRGLAGAGRRHQHGGVVRAQGRGQAGQRGVDRKRWKIHYFFHGRPACRFAASGVTRTRDNAGEALILPVIMPAAQKAPQKAQAAAAPLSAPLKKSDHVFLVDGSGYIFRAYHALPPINRKSDGLQLNAVFGFCNMLWKLLRDMKPEDKPTHLAVVFDKSEKTFRTEMYPDYKAHRPDPPDDLRPQFKFIREAVHAFDLPCLEQDGFEADDLIATYVRQACEAGATATIVSSDKDLMQLVNDCVVMFDTMKDKKIGRAEVIEKFGVPPEKVIEVQSLIGDSTDNVPGVPGIGVKTAAQLIGEYGDLETLLTRAGEIKQEKRRQSLIDNAEKARLSKKLVTLDANVKLDVPIGDLAVHEPDHKRLDRLSQGDGIQLADAPRRGVFQHRCRRDRGRSAARRWPLFSSPASGRGRERSARKGSASRCRAATRARPAGAAGRCRPESNRRSADVSLAHPASARGDARGSRAQCQIRPHQIRDGTQPGTAQSVARARARRWRCCRRYLGRQPRSDAGRAVRFFARGGAE